MFTNATYGGSVYMASSASLPDGAYLERIGTVAYLTSSVEWTILGDIPRLGDRLPPTINLNDLAGKTTGKIGRLLSRYAPQVAEPGLAAYLTAAGDALTEIADMRNTVLHARPATQPDGRQRLYRWLPSGSSLFVIDEVLDRMIGRIDELHLAVLQRRQQANL